MRPLARLALLLVAALALAPAPARAGAEPSALRGDHLPALLQGVRRIAKPGVPGPIALVGERSFAVVAGDLRGGARGAVVAAALHGLGRVVAFGHGGYLTPKTLESADTGALLLNALRWAGQARKGAPVGVVGHGALVPFLEARGLGVRGLDARGWVDALDDVGVLVLARPDLGGAKAEQALERFLRRGGGLVTAGLAWGWMQLNPERSLTKDHRLNAALAPLGLFFGDGYVERLRGVEESGGDLLDACHALLGLEVLGTGSTDAEVRRAAVRVVAHAYRWSPDGHDAFRERVRRLLRRAGHAAGTVAPTQDDPVAAEDALARLSLVVDHVDALEAPPEEVSAARSAADFPGALPPGAKTETRVVRVEGGVPGWTSTGLYAPPGGVVEVEGEDGADLRGLGVRIGCHTDRLWDKPEWRRHPEISRRWPLGAGATRVASPHGGLVYVEVPARRPEGAVEVRIRGAAPAPYFVLGETEPEAWRERIRHAPAPWAELATDEVVLTVRSQDVRGIEDPTEILELWRRVLKLYAELGQRPLRGRPERLVPDRQISAGWMHSGYPIMMQLQHSALALDLARLRDAPPTASHAWGFWHELGHNHQRPEWTFAGTGEVTCNLFSLYVDDRIRGVVPSEHPWPKPKWAKVERYFDGPRDFAVWKRDPGLALWTYILVQEAFGWEAFQRVFAAYAELPPSERPRTDDAKRDQWLVRLSRSVGHDLGPYLEAWGVPTSEAARVSVADLPAWMPERLEALLD